LNLQQKKSVDNGNGNSDGYSDDDSIDGNDGKDNNNYGSMATGVVPAFLLGAGGHGNVDCCSWPLVA
jgi:hypothetical protein